MHPVLGELRIRRRNETTPSSVSSSSAQVGSSRTHPTNTVLLAEASRTRVVCRDPRPTRRLAGRAHIAPRRSGAQPNRYLLVGDGCRTRSRCASSRPNRVPPVFGDGAAKRILGVGSAAPGREPPGAGWLAFRHPPPGPYLLSIRLSWALWRLLNPTRLDARRTHVDSANAAIDDSSDPLDVRVEPAPRLGLDPTLDCVLAEAADAVAEAWMFPTEFADGTHVETSDSGKYSSRMRAAFLRKDISLIDKVASRTLKRAGWSFGTQLPAPCRSEVHAGAFSSGLRECTHGASKPATPFGRLPAAEPHRSGGPSGSRSSPRLPDQQGDPTMPTVDYTDDATPAG